VLEKAGKAELPHVQVALLICISRQENIFRYLFVRCDNSPAPWSTKGETLSFPGWIYGNNTDYGDSPSLEVPEDAKREIKQASGRVYEMGDDPYWCLSPSKVILRGFSLV